MTIDVPALLAFNRGIISKLALARVDVGRVQLSAEEQTNWMPRTLGSMMLRPGLAYRGATKDNATAVHIPFVFSLSDTAIIELTDGAMRVRRGTDDAVITRLVGTAVAGSETTIANGSFDTDLTSWTEEDDLGASSFFVSGGIMGLLGTGFASARRRQLVTYVARADQDYALNVEVTRGPVTLRVGTTEGGDELIPEATLATGSHSLAFAPTTDFWIEFSNARRFVSHVSSIVMAPRSEMVITTPWAEADLPFVRWDQSRDVVFVACRDKPPYRIERRGLDSWSVVEFQPDTGPFRLENTGTTTITPNGINGDILLTASEPLFRAGHLGALFRLTSFGQSSAATLSGEDQFSDPIRVTGVGASQRTFSYSIALSVGSGSTVTLQRSVGAPGAWLDVTSTTSATSTTLNDGFDNQIIYYRLGIKPGDYTAATVVAVSLSYDSGSITGVARITNVLSDTTANARVVSPLGGTAATATWSEGLWSTLRGYPSAVVFYEGRLWWFGQDRIIGSASDAFDDYDETVEGDAASISRTIGAGPTEVINWALPLQRLLIGGQGATFSARSSSLDEPLTPSAFSLKSASSQGSAAVAAVPVDVSGYYVQRSGTRLYELSVSEARAFDYGDSDVTALVPEIGQPSIVRLAVQRQPDTRIHCVRSDGKVAVLVTDRAEDVRCWMLVETDGVVEDAFVLPGDVEDAVYYSVRRTINGATKRYLERWAMESEGRGGLTNRLADSYITYSGAARVTFTVAHLEGKEVIVWGNGGAVEGTFTVSGGSITVPSALTTATIGLGYQARFKSSKLAYAAPVGTALTMRKRIVRLGMIMADTHSKGIRYGQSFDYMSDLPGVERGKDVVANSVWTEYDNDTFMFPGNWDTDGRLCLLATAPYPATALAAILVMEGHRNF